MNSSPPIIAICGPFRSCSPQSPQSPLSEAHLTNRMPYVFFCARFTHISNAVDNVPLPEGVSQEGDSVTEVTFLWNLGVRPHLAHLFEVILTVANA
jgi:hypothetical protein